MSWFDDLADEATINNQSSGIEFDDKAPDPTFFQGFGHANSLNWQKGGAKIGNTLQQFGGAEGRVGAYYSADDYQILQKKNIEQRASEIKELTPDPAKTGKAGQYISPLFDVIPRTVVGSVLGGPAVGAVMAGAPEYLASKDKAMSEGIDEKTASQMGLIDSFIMGGGALLPGGHMVKNIAGDAALAVGGNVGLGMLSRGGTSEILRANGYHVQADQYQVFDKNAIAVDAILGAAFFGVSRVTGNKPSQEAIDAALTEKQSQHLANDSAPGAPVNAKSNIQHQENVEQAIDQLVRGEPVQAKHHDMTFINQPRGIRNNNPGNIVSDGTKWQGMTGNDGRFLQFETAELGLRAMARTLLTYQDKHGLTTIAGIVNRYAPQKENNTQAYIDSVAKRLGLDPNAPLNLHNRDTLGKLTEAIIHHENGKNPYTAAQIDAGVGKALSRVSPDTAGATVRNQLAMRDDVPEALRNQIADKYDAVSKTKPAFDQAIQDIAKASGSQHEPLIPYDMKGSQRAADKIINDYRGNVEGIKDLNRATMVVDNYEQALNAIQGVRDKFGEVLSVRNHLSPDSEPLTLDGYRDIKMNVMVDGHIAEVQINAPEMIAAKEKAHGFYEDVQSIFRQADKENRKLTPDEVTQVHALRAKQKTLYEEAWRETSKRNEASDINVPFLRADIYGNSRGAGSQAVQDKSGAIDTGTPSTSANSVPSGNDLGNINLTPRSMIIHQGLTGKQNTAYTERGTAIETEYVVVDTQQLTTSHDDNLAQNPSYSQELQPRDRSRDASEAQISKIENRINPELLAESAKVSDGAPIIGADGMVESGNARTIGVRRAYASGKAAQYRDWLMQNAKRFGVDPNEVAKLEQPMLVRLRKSEVERAEFARQANESNVAQMSATEQANADSSRLMSLDGLITNDDGSINVSASGQFIRGFMQDVVSPSEQGAMITADGQLSQQGLSRIVRTVFAKAYKDPELIAMWSEATDSNIKNIMNGMVRAAPALARLKNMIDAGARYSIDVSPELVEAVRKFAQIRADKSSVEQFLSQANLFGDGISPEVNNLLIGLQENSRSAKRVADMITSFVDSIDQMGDPRQAGMFGDDLPAAHDFIANSVDQMRRQDATPETAGLFDSTESAAANDVVKSNPNMILERDPDGNPITVQQAMQAADDALKQADSDSQAFDAAIKCFLRT